MTGSELKHRREDTLHADTFKRVSGTHKILQADASLLPQRALTYLDQGHILGPMDVQQGSTASKHNIN